MEEEEEAKEEAKERRLKEVNASLAGMKVAHDITQIGEGDTILTLRVCLHTMFHCRMLR